MAADTAGLADIARADVSPAQAREILRSIFDRPTPDLLRDAYLALRAWAWNALDQRRRDPDLREWHDIIGATARLMVEHGRISLGERLDALAELIGESIAAGERFGAINVNRRQHVAKALRFLAENGGRAKRGDIGEHLGLRQANLTRVLNMMCAAGVVERSTLGRNASYALSRAGEKARRRPVVETEPRPED